MNRPVATVWVMAGLLAAPRPVAGTETVALWLFDEPAGLYPSSVMDSSAGLDAPLVLGLGGQLIAGRFGRALTSEDYPPIQLPAKGEASASLGRLPVPAGRTMEPLTWHNAQFTALMTTGERHLRKEVTFVNPTDGDLNLGDFDWTVEFWWMTAPGRGRGVIFELGTGPRGENDRVTCLEVDPAAGEFVLRNQAGGVELRLPAATALADAGRWHHFAFVHHAVERRLVQFADGRRQGEVNATGLRRLPHGDEAYLSIGRDGKWQRPMPGTLDELRFSRGVVYGGNFDLPGSFAPAVPVVPLHQGAPLLFMADAPRQPVVPLGTRKHVFIDDALVAESAGIRFVPKPPRRIERVIDQVEGQFRKHLTVIEDEGGLLRLYNGVTDDYLAVRTSRDGVHWEIPDTGLHHKGNRNIVIPEPAPLGRPIIDPNGPPEMRWKYLSGLEGRGVYLYVSPDGWKWRRVRTAVAPFRSGSQSSFFYDDQRGCYVAYHRTGFGQTPGGATKREFVCAETTDPFHPWPFTLQTQAEVWAIAKQRPLRQPQPWWLDNGPLTPGDFGVEYPTVFSTEPPLDRPGDGIYVPKATKYPWAPDTYLAFPAVYHQWGEGSVGEKLMLLPRRLWIGSGDFRTQVAVSRDGIYWNRYRQPAYVPEITYEGRTLHQIYMAEGLVRRGEEVWQYFYGQEEYHSPPRRIPGGNGVYRAIQRLDGFVAAEDTGPEVGRIVTRVLTFAGGRLVLNIDAGVKGTVRVGILDEAGAFEPGFKPDDCRPLRGSMVAGEVVWAGKGSDVSSLAGRPVRLVLQLHGASLYAFQFIP